MSTLTGLFFTFLKIGAVSFGGHMALIAIVQKELVDKQKLISNEEILDYVAIASLLPGPLAVNVVSYIGYALRGWTGAAISFLAIILPATVLMLVLSVVYFNFLYQVNVGDVMLFLTICISVIILSTGVQLFKKGTDKRAAVIVLCLISVLVPLFFNSHFAVMGLVVFGAIFGYFYYKSPAPPFTKWFPSIRWKSTHVVLLLLGICELLFLSKWYAGDIGLLNKIWVIFSGMSLSLFGGGFVVIPFMQSILVNDLNWITNQQFIDAIAFGQITPGPILVSATFVGYKMAGVTGGLIATLAIFLPSALLTICVGNSVNRSHTIIVNILNGIKPVIVGLILSSGLQILFHVNLKDLTTLCFLVIMLILSFIYKISPLYLIPVAIIVGIITSIL